MEWLSSLSSRGQDNIWGNFWEEILSAHTLGIDVAALCLLRSFNNDLRMLLSLFKIYLFNILFDFFVLWLNSSFWVCSVHTHWICAFPWAQRENGVFNQWLPNSLLTISIAFLLVWWKNFMKDTFSWEDLMVVCFARKNDNLVFLHCKIERHVCDDYLTRLKFRHQPLAAWTGCARICNHFCNGVGFFRAVQADRDWWRNLSRGR